MRGQASFATDDAAATWVPSENDLARSRLRTAMSRWGYHDLAALHQASIDDPGWFWPIVLDDLGIDFTKPYDAVLDDSPGYEFPLWFVGGRFNIVTSCVERHANSSYADKPAVCYEADSGASRHLTHRQLAEEVHRIADAFLELGVGKGDRVALFLPVMPEATVAFLACARIGAIAVPMFSGCGADAVAARLNDSDAVMLVTADRTTRRARLVEMKSIADEALAASCTVTNVVVISSALTPACHMTDGRDHYWKDLQPQRRTAAAEELDPNHPLMIIYTSGTTGKPKGIIHSHVGYLVKAAVDFGYAFDLQVDDVLSWITDLGWNLGPLMIVGGLHFGATIVMIEGVPHHPTADRLWRIVDRYGVTVQGIAPTAARILMPLTDAMNPSPELPTVRAFASTGEAWDNSSWQWLFESIGKGRVPILNYTGGTEVGGGILSGYTILPHRGPGFCGPLLGMDVAVLDPTGTPVTGVPGELALLNTWPGIALGFWNDVPRYLETYWSQHPGVWVHGDLARVDQDGYWTILGRSDDTIKIAGRRVGPGEIESALLAIPAIAEAAVIGVPDPLRGQRIVAFVVPSDPAQVLDRRQIDRDVGASIGKSLVPSAVHVVRGLPRTKNGKILRRTIRARYLSEPLGELSALDAATPVEDIPVLAVITATGASPILDCEISRATFGRDTA